MKIELVEKKEDWNNFVIENNGSFLQSFEWGELKKKSSSFVKRIRIIDNSFIILQAQIVKEKIPFLSYLYIPYGPVFNKSSLSDVQRKAFFILLDTIKEISRKLDICFLKIEPVISLPPLENKLCFFSSAKRIQPLKTMILNIDRKEEEILQGLDSKIRYNIRLAERKGVEIKIFDYYLPIFYSLLKETSRRQKFNIYPEEHYKTIFEIADSQFIPKMFLAEYQKKIILANITIFFGKRAYSIHLGWDYNYRQFKAIELKHWQGFMLAKKLGCKEYDFWGIDERRFPGVTNFKKGFNGIKIEYPEGIDIVFNKGLYKTYLLLKRLKNIF